MKNILIFFIIVALSGVALGYWRNSTIGSRDFGREPQTKKTQTVHIYLTKIVENEPEINTLGCGDTLVAIEQEVSPTVSSEAAALHQLLALKQQKIDEYYNALSASNLTFESARYTDHGTKIVVDLRGQFSLAGVCDGPRIKAQLERTAMQRPEVNEAIILLNSIPLENHFSGQ